MGLYRVPVYTDYSSMYLPDEDYFLIKAYLVDDDESIVITDGYDRDLDIVQAPIDQNEFYLLLHQEASLTIYNWSWISFLPK